MGGRHLKQPKKKTISIGGRFRKIDIFVLPSVSESFPNALLEAMASGCACVATRVGGIPELIEDNRSGLLFANGDAGALAAHLDRLLKDTALRRQLGTAAAARARAEFPVNAYCRRMEALYDTLLTSQRAQRLRQM
jgi:glycosyltransferase involved in cell wall biosynthesis